MTVDNRMDLDSEKLAESYPTIVNNPQAQKPEMISPYFPILTGPVEAGVVKEDLEDASHETPRSYARPRVSGMSGEVLQPLAWIQVPFLSEPGSWPPICWR